MNAETIEYLAKCDAENLNIGRTTLDRMDGSGPQRVWFIGISESVTADDCSPSLRLAYEHHHAGGKP